MNEKIKHYTNGEITINWQPTKCIHAAECVKALPKVYKPNEKAWLQIENATTVELKAQIAKCPSGALSYSEAIVNDDPKKSAPISATLMENGPLVILGDLSISNTDGSKDIKKGKTAFCRCGASSNKPYCDGSHVKIGFKG